MGRKEWMWVVVAVIVGAVSFIYGFTPGRDTQPVSVENSSIKIEGGNTEPVEVNMSDLVVSETDSWTRTTVNGYEETSITYSNVNKISVYVETTSKTIRVSANSADTSGDYAVIRSDALGWTNSNLKYPSYTIKLKGDTESDTATVCIHVEHYGE